MTGKTPVIVKYNSSKVLTEEEIKLKNENIEAEKQRMLEHEKGVRNKMLYYTSIVIAIPIVLLVLLYFSYSKYINGKNQQSYILGGLAAIIIFYYATNAQIFGTKLGTLTYDIFRRKFPSAERWLIMNEYVKY